MEYPVVKFKELGTISTGKYDVNHASIDGEYFFFTCAAEPFKSETYSFDGEAIILPGNGANVGLVLYYNGKFEAYQRTYILSKIKAFPKYVYYVFQANWAKNVKYKQYGSATNYIRYDNISEFPVILPPLSDQQRIATILDHSDSIRRKNRQILEKYNELAQSVFYEMFGDPLNNSKGWKISKIGSLVSKIESGWSPICKDHPRISEINWAVLKLSAVTYKVFNPNENKEILDHLSPKTELEVKTGDLLFSRKNTRELVGACAFVHNSPPNLMIPDTIFRLKYIDNLINPVFLWFLLNDKIFSKHIQNLSNGSAASMPNISKSKLMEFEIFNPPKEIQDQFGKIVLQIECQKNTAHKSLALSEDLFQSMLQMAFKGEL